MPYRTCYIRTGDIEAFDTLKNRSEFIHNALKGVVPVDDGSALSRTWAKKVADPLDKAILAGINNMGMACCKLPAPCKHWRFDDIKSEYTNILTGEVRDAS